MQYLLISFIFMLSNDIQQVPRVAVKRSQMPLSNGRQKCANLVTPGNHDIINSVNCKFTEYLIPMSAKQLEFTL